MGTQQLQRWQQGLGGLKAQQQIIPQETGRPPAQPNLRRRKEKREKMPQLGLLTCSSSTGSTQKGMWGWVLMFGGVGVFVSRVQLGPSSGKWDSGWERG